MLDIDITSAWLSITHGEQLLFIRHNTEIVVLTLYTLLVPLRKPVLEVSMIFVAQLSIELCIVEIPTTRVVNLTD